MDFLAKGTSDFTTTPKLRLTVRDPFLLGNYWVNITSKIIIHPK